MPIECNDLGINVFDDGTTDITLLSEYTPGFNLYADGTWSADLQVANVQLSNGYYHIFLASKCGTSSYEYPLYLDMYLDAAYVIPAGCDENCVPVHRFYNFKRAYTFTQVIRLKLPQ